MKKKTCYLISSSLTSYVGPSRQFFISKLFLSISCFFLYTITLDLPCSREASSSALKY